MKIVALPVMAVLLMTASVAAWGGQLESDSYVIGGSYRLAAGQEVPGSLRAIFAQVTIEDGAQVHGAILSLSSTLDLAGSVDGEVVAVGSDVTLRQTASLGHGARQVRLAPYVVLLPEMTRTGWAARQPQ